MDPDEYQQAWQAQSSRTSVKVDIDQLANEVERSQREFRATIVVRDAVEIGVGLLLLPIWFVLGAWSGAPWTFYLTVPVLLWMVGFMWMYRKRHQQTPNEPGEPLLRCVERSLAEVDAQIWLLRNVFWWYLLPPGISISIFFAHVSWKASQTWQEALAGGCLTIGFLVALYYWVYRLNQRAVRDQLEPRHRELATLLTSLAEEKTNGEETLNEVNGEFPILMGAQRTACSRRRPLVVVAGLMAFVLIGLTAFLVKTEPSERSPFAAVRWQDDQPEVRIGQEWFELVSLDGVPATEIVAFSQGLYPDQWRKRFEEDLVELLTKMGHPPQDTVTLIVRLPNTTETRTLERIPMTAANRRAIRNAAQSRGSGER